MNIIDNNFRPYLMGTFYSWAVNNNMHPYIEILNNSRNNIPNTKVGEKVVINIHPEAIRESSFSNTALAFKATFGGVSKDVLIYYDSIISIFTSEGNCHIDFGKIDEPRPNLYRIK